MAVPRTLRAFAPAVVLALFLGMFAPGQGEDPVPPQAPRVVRLPSGAEVPVRTVGTEPDGELRVPGDARSAGWWRGGSRVGDASGKTLLAAHVDAPGQGLGPFAELYATRPGARVVLRSEDLVQVFRIRSARLVPRGSVAGRPGLYSLRGSRRLVLVTCAPPYDARHGGYRNLLVVVAAPTGPARASR
ncbi:MAG: class F sortase [Nocardioides sp.]